MQMKIEMRKKGDQHMAVYTKNFFSNVSQIILCKLY